MTRCTAISKSTHKRCQRDATHGRTRCPSHTTKKAMPTKKATHTKRVTKCVTKRTSTKRRTHRGGCGCNAPALLPQTGGG